MVYERLHEDAMEMEVDDAGKMRWLGAVPLLQLLRLPLLVVVAGLGLRHDVVASLPASLLRLHLRYIIDLIRSYPKQLKNKRVT